MQVVSTTGLEGAMSKYVNKALVSGYLTGYFDLSKHFIQGATSLLFSFACSKLNYSIEGKPIPAKSAWDIIV